MDQYNKELLAEDLCSGDRQAITVAGIAVSQSIKAQGYCLLSTDSLGRVVLCKLKEELRVPRVKDEDLDKVDEQSAITAMVKEGRSEQDIIHYLSRRPQEP